MNEHELLIELIGFAPYIFQKHPEMRDNKEYIKASMMNSSCIANWSDEQINDKELILDYVKTASALIENNNGKYASHEIVIREVSDELKQDESFLKEVLKIIGKKANLRTHYKSDSVLYKIHQDINFLNELADMGQAHAINVEHLSDEKKKDKALIKKCVSQGYFELLEKSDYHLRNNLVFAYECMKLDPECSHFFGKKINDATPGVGHGLDTFYALEKYLLHKKLIKVLPIKAIKTKVVKI